jgi:protein-tyrosine phosphatase
MPDFFWSCVFWVHGEPSAPLAIVLCPRGGRRLREALGAFKRGGVETLVSLLGEDEAKWLDLSQEGPLAEKLGMQFVSFPLPDHDIPPDKDAFRAFAADLARRLRSGEQIGVHCLGSIGRSTITVACALIELGWEPQAALDAIEAARGCPVPDLKEQEEWILGYKERA